VDLLRLIQLGITFSDESGELAEECPTWQFNFRFSLEEDVFAADSIALLQRSGIDFASHQEKGIEMEAFGELLMSSGLVLCDNIKWISFHSAYDFAYLLKLLTNTTLPGACLRGAGLATKAAKARTPPPLNLPPPPPLSHTRAHVHPTTPRCLRAPPAADEEAFTALLNTYFPTVYDVKHLLQFASSPIHGGLQRVGDELKVARVGQQHQAGSDSLLTSGVFFKLKSARLGGRLEPAWAGLYGMAAAVGGGSGGGGGGGSGGGGAAPPA
jgi:CCR4-NOT transcription complex subunit 7/8